LKSTSGWNFNAGTDNYGFRALPGGDYAVDLDMYGNLFDQANFWSASEYGAPNVSSRTIDDAGDTNVHRYTGTSKIYPISLRCLQD
jgi:uncharacterized protein (TIGR02145 family)